MKLMISLLSIAAAVLLAGCEQSPAKPAGSGKAAPPAGVDTHEHKPGDGHDHTDEKKPEQHSGETIALGSAKIGALDVRAARDKSEMTPGGEAPIDAWLTGPDGKPASARVVRCWIGVEDAKGAIKAKAEIEDAKDTSHFHAHAEIPDPMPGDCRLWIEIEDEKGVRSTGSFPLKS